MQKLKRTFDPNWVYSDCINGAAAAADGWVTVILQQAWGWILLVSAFTHFVADTKRATICYDSFKGNWD